MFHQKIIFVSDYWGAEKHRSSCIFKLHNGNVWQLIKILRVAVSQEEQVEPRR